MRNLGSGNDSMSRALAVMTLLIVIALAAIASAQERASNREELILAEGEYVRGNYERARDRLDRVLSAADASDRQKLEALVWQARCSAQLADSTRAIAAFTEALKIDPAWRPGAEDLEASELVLYEQARAGFEVRQSLLALPLCPGKTTPIVATVALIASSAFFLAAKGSTDDSWADYEADPSHPNDLYDEYESAKKRQDIAVIAAAATGLATGYLWYRYVHTSRNCRNEEEVGMRLDLQFGVPRVAVVGRF